VLRKTAACLAEFESNRIQLCSPNLFFRLVLPDNRTGVLRQKLQVTVASSLVPLLNCAKRPKVLMLLNKTVLPTQKSASLTPRKRRVASSDPAPEHDLFFAKEQFPLSLLSLTLVVLLTTLVYGVFVLNFVLEPLIGILPMLLAKLLDMSFRGALRAGRGAN